MAKPRFVLTISLLVMSIGTTCAAQCLHASGEEPAQFARRRDALLAARTINTIEINQPGAPGRVFMRQVELASSPYWLSVRDSNEAVKRISLNPDEDILPGWKLILDVTEHGYWFMIKDTMDACGFAYVSNQTGLIFKAEPIR